MIIARLGPTCLLALALATGIARAQSHSTAPSTSGSHNDSTGQGNSPSSVPAATGGVPYWMRYPPFYESIGPDGRPIVYVPPRLILVRPGSLQAIGPLPAPPGGLTSGTGVAGPWPPPGMAAPKQPAAIEPNRTVRTDPARANQLMTYGDRLFRSGNLHRAAERFEQAMKSDPTSAGPRVRLAQVALVRGDFSEAADRYREATIAEPEWLINAPDIQTIYSEPGDFARVIARLETHLQAHPNDRDAWLVLGAQWYLSGRTRQAADIFLRLTDRKIDPTLAAFLDASTPAEQ